MAIYESAEEVQELIIDSFDQTTGRGDFLRTILAIGGAAAAAGVGATLFNTEHASAETLQARLGVTDLDILNYALTLEHIEATFYRNVSPMDAPTAQVANYVKIIAAHEKAHVDGLTAAIMGAKGTPAKEAKYNFPKISLPFGIVVENLGVGAYLGAAPFIKSSAVLLTAASIVTVEARHASAWATIYNSPTPAQSFAPNAFDKGIDMATVVKAVTPFFVK